jgi:signal transduction histidine kinase
MGQNADGKLLESGAFLTTFPAVNPPESSEEILPWKKLTAKAVHDMRTPLSSLRTSVEILKMISHDPEKTARVISLLENQVEELSQQMERLVKDPASFVVADKRPF